MDIKDFVLEKAYIILPFLWVLGSIFKNLKLFSDKFIPLFLLLPGILGAVSLMGLSVEAVIQGVLLTGLAVYGNQVLKQISKDE